MKNIWIINHYATKLILNKEGRHFWFSKHLNDRGFNSAIFCASTIHHRNTNLINSKELYSIRKESPLQILIKTNNYTKNDIHRVRNIINFYKNILKSYKNVAKEIGSPDIVYGSSAHPLTLLAGLKIAKYFNVPFISEVRDLWPESIVAYGILSRNNPAVKLLYKLEKYIYYKSDQLIFTMPGAQKYLEEQNLMKSHGGKIEQSKINLLNNGVDLKTFNEFLKEYNYKDSELDDLNRFSVVYTGSIKEANKHLWGLIEAAKLLSKDYDDIDFLIFGEGAEREKLENYCLDNNINNIIFKGNVNYEYIPSILSKSDINVLNCKPKEILRFGGSQNKLFQYLASGKPIITAEDNEFSLVKNINGGIAKAFNDANELSEAIITLKNYTNEKNEEIKSNLLEASKEYDYKSLTNDLVNIFEKA